MKHPFNDEELTVIFEVANVAIADNDVAIEISEKLDLSDHEMFEIAEKLYKFMNP